jgi:hypothetical protein
MQIEPVAWIRLSLGFKIARVSARGPIKFANFFGESMVNYSFGDKFATHGCWLVSMKT